MKLCLFVLCETGWRQTMCGQQRYKHSMDRGSRTLWDKNKKRSSRAKKDKSIEFVVDCVEWEVCKDR
jgi:hypothetical protein